MAHVKVVRRSMGKNEWIRLRATWISKRVIQHEFAIENWQVREARQVGELTYEFYDKEYRPITKGDMYFTPDGTSFLKASTEFPDSFLSKEVWFTLETAAEMLIKINGKWAGGIDPNRHRLLISPFVDKTGRIEIEIEGYNRSKPDDERNPQASALRGCRQVFSGGSLVLVDAAVEGAMYDVNILMEAMDSESIDEHARNFIVDELDHALNLVEYEEADHEQYLEGIHALRLYIKEHIFNNKLYQGSGKVALVAHSHLDIAYYWKRVHSIQKNARTCLIQLRLMDKYPEFKYCHTQAYTYETLETHYPEIFEELRTRINEGRFEIAGAMYVEPDCNIPTAEALVRQCMYGQHFFHSRFNKTIENCWLPDVFGNSWILPQILKKAGVKYFVSNKMSTWNDTNRFPHNHFIWKGIDGSEVFACVPPTHFITWNTPEQITENWDSFLDKNVCDETLNMFGYGDGGSGATEQMLEYARRMNQVPGVPAVRHIRADEFLKENLSEEHPLAVWDGELYLEMHRGTFTTKGILKKLNRDLEILLRDCELISTIAYLDGHAYPYEALTKAWKTLLVNQFHDILPGTHIAPVTTDALRDYHEIEESLRTILSDAAEFLKLQKLKTKGTPEQTDSNSNLTLLNTLAWSRTGANFLKGDYGMFHNANRLKTQLGTCNGETGLWVMLKELPAFSTQTLTLDEAAVEKVVADTNWFQLNGLTLNTDFYRVVFQPDGSITSLLNKEDTRELVAPNQTINKLKIYRDNPGMYDAWDILPNYKDREESLEVIKGLTLVEAGAICISLTVKLKTKHSNWKQTLRFFRDNPRIEFEHEVDWQETNRLAKAEFNLNLLTRYAKCDTSAGAIIRETHKNTTWQQARFEVCHHKWADLSEAGFGVALMNNGKYGISFEENNMSLTLLRATIRPDVYSDHGIHNFTYALLPHQNSPEDAGINAEAWKFNAPLRIFHGVAKNTQCFMQLSPSNLHLQAFKRPEIDQTQGGVIVRFAELDGKRGKGTFQLSQGIVQATKVNLLEDPEEQMDYQVNEGVLHFDYKPFEIISFCITVNKNPDMK